jgi:hypothetical protein
VCGDLAGGPSGRRAPPPHPHGMVTGRALPGLHAVPSISSASREHYSFGASAPAATSGGYNSLVTPSHAIRKRSLALMSNGG